MFDPDKWYQGFYKAPKPTIEEKARHIDLVPTLTVDQLIQNHGNKIKNIYSDLWNTNISDITLKRVSDSLALGGINSEMMADFEFNIETFANTQFNPVMQDIVRICGVSMITDINNSLGANMFFDTNLPETIDFINNETASMITNVISQTRESVQLLITEAITNGYGAHQTKLMMEMVQTLTFRESQAVIKRYNQVFNTNFDKFIADGYGRSRAISEAKRIAQVYAKRYHRQLMNVRRERIARTEYARAKHHADISSFNQAINAGKLKSVKKRWVRTGHNDNWPSSELNDMVMVDLNDRFPYEDSEAGGSSAWYPSAINERCYLEYVMYP